MWDLPAQVLPVEQRHDPHEDSQRRKTLQVMQNAYVHIYIYVRGIYLTVQKPLELHQIEMYINLYIDPYGYLRSCSPNLLKVQPLPQGVLRLEHADEAPPDPQRREAIPMQTMPPKVLTVGKPEQAHEDPRRGHGRGGGGGGGSGEHRGRRVQRCIALADAVKMTKLRTSCPFGVLSVKLPDSYFYIGSSTIISYCLFITL